MPRDEMFTEKSGPASDRDNHKSSPPLDDFREKSIYPAIPRIQYRPSRISILRISVSARLCRHTSIGEKA